MNRMKLNNFAFLIVLTSIVTTGQFATAQGTAMTEEIASFDEYEAIEEALQPYIISARTGDGALTRTAFYDHAHVVGSIGGTVYNMDADTFAGAIADGGPSDNVRHHIAWINVSGPAAAARVEFIDWGGNRFTDFFVLYKEGDVWKISGKVYNSHTNN
ncbi:Putative lumazine-binding protein [Roseovarius albus]|uniref:Putative lumazine-binding protein n=1 Tax=Roseovarius albus TaxID=1247867 RepID=A0A1X6ZV01_9RHOB|nr:nuclear transport factor 2 family protein [Roseovarius albus]SLN62200.1 Putative lumazine-binding protein [Roseovarius albus]